MCGRNQHTLAKFEFKKKIEKKGKTLNGIFRLFSGLEEGNCLGNEHCGFKTWKKQRRVVKKCHSTQEEELDSEQKRDFVFPGGGWMEER